MNQLMNASVLLQNTVDNKAIIFQKTINLLCQGRGKCLQLPYYKSPNKLLVKSI